MATVTGYTKEKMQDILNSTIVDASVVSGHLILSKEDGSTIDVGVVGGLARVTAFPAGPTDGDAIIRTDLVGSPIFTYSTENGWEQVPRMGAVTVPAVKAYATALQSIPNNVYTAIALNAERYDTDAMHDLAVNNTRLVCNTPGIYNIVGAVGGYDSSNQVGFRYAAIRVTRTDATVEFSSLVILNATDVANGASMVIPVASTVKLGAGDYVELLARQTSGGALNATPDAAASTNPYTNFLALHWMGGPGQTVDERGVPAVRSIDTTGTQAIPTGVETAVSFNTNLYDTDGTHVSGTRFTAKTPGLYSVTSNVRITATPAGTARYIYIKKNGTEVVALNQISGLTALDFNISAQVMLAGGDYLELIVFQSSGASYTLPAASTTSPNLAEFAMAHLGSGKIVTPFAKIYRSTTQSVPTNVLTTVGFDGERADNDSIHDPTINNTRMVCRTAGVYAIGTSISYAADAVNKRQVFLNVTRASGAVETIAVFERNASNAAGGITIVRGVTMVEMAVGDYAEIQAYHNSTTTPLNIGGTGATTQYVAEAWMLKIGAPNNGSTGIEPIEGWHIVGGPGEPAFQNGYVLQASGGAALRFKKDRNRVTINGVVNAAGRTAGQQAVFTLPAGYIPSQMSRVPMLAYNGAGYVVGALTVGNDGVVTVRGPDDQTVPITFTWMMMEISFLVG